ncbi:uncharacterized protein LOC134235899 [Saccostrea cucullata]|uniref:uncharacterized protein LOC134235899 n=1 Tax=Saccostrea cuccullata TaxID=36930 RepID=UPI002ED0F968
MSIFSTGYCLCWIPFLNWIITCSRSDTISTPGDPIRTPTVKESESTKNNNQVLTVTPKHFKTTTFPQLSGLDGEPINSSSMFTEQNSGNTNIGVLRDALNKTLHLPFLKCLQDASLNDCLYILSTEIIMLGNHDVSLTSLREDFCILPSIENNNYTQVLFETGVEKVDLFWEIYIDVLNVVFFTFGSICNIVTILVIISKPRFRKPFYLSILSLSLADLLVLLSDFLMVSIYNEDLCQVLYQKEIMQAVSFSTSTFSYLNIVLLATVRYVTFAHPIKSRVYLRNKLILKISMAMFLSSIGYAVAMVYATWFFLIRYVGIIHILEDAVFFLGFVILNVIFLVRRLIIAKSSLASGHLKKRMTCVVLIILMLNTVASLTTVIRDLFESGYFEKEEMTFLLPFFKHFLYFSHSVNPLLYFFTSRRVIKFLYSKCIK